MGWRRPPGDGRDDGWFCPFPQYTLCGGCPATDSSYLGVCVCVLQDASIYPIATARHQSQHHGWPLCTLLFTWISCRSQYRVKRNISSTERSCTQIHSSRWLDDESTYICVAYTFSFALALWKMQWYRVTVVSISQEELYDLAVTLILVFSQPTCRWTLWVGLYRFLQVLLGKCSHKVSLGVSWGRQQKAQEDQRHKLR